MRYISVLSIVFIDFLREREEEREKIIKSTIINYALTTTMTNLYTRIHTYTYLKMHTHVTSCRYAHIKLTPSGMQFITTEKNLHNFDSSVLGGLAWRKWAWKYEEKSFVKSPEKITGFWPIQRWDRIVNPTLGLWFSCLRQYELFLTFWNT